MEWQTDVMKCEIRANLILKHSTEKQAYYLLVRTDKKKDAWTLPSDVVNRGGSIKQTAQTLLSSALDLSSSILLKSLLQVRHSSQDAAVEFTYLATTENNSHVFKILPRPDDEASSDLNDEIFSWFSYSNVSSCAFDEIKTELKTIIGEVEKGYEGIGLSILSEEQTDSSRNEEKCVEQKENKVEVKTEPLSSPLNSYYKTLMSTAKFGNTEKHYVRSLFQRFAGSCENKLDETSFGKLIATLGTGLESYSIENLFRAFDREKKSSLDLNDVLCGLAAMDPGTVHGGTPAELRCRYIFKYYNVTQTGYLSLEELKEMMKDIAKSKNELTTDEKLDIKAKEQIKIFGEDLIEKLPLKEFLDGVGHLKFRGTSLLFRLPSSLSEIVAKTTKQSARLAKKRKLLQKAKQHTEDVDVENIEETMDLDESQVNNNNTANSGMMSYELATHVVKVRRSGALTNVSQLCDMTGTGALAKSVQDLMANDRFKFTRMSSVNSFNEKSIPNEMLFGLRYFERSITNSPGGCASKDAFSWGEVDMKSFAKCILSTCHSVREIVVNEARLLKIESPTYILGDLHGNFHDLVCFEKVLWRMGPILTPSTFLFLGDYVDRGEHGIEVVAYLFAQKLLAPSKFFLIRGNHEIRETQKIFTFYKECKRKFGKEVGVQVWEAINLVFDALPLAACIDDKIFCVHGGIPLPKHGGGFINEINRLPKNLRQPMDVELAWELLWNDPLRCEEISEEIKAELVENDGFVSNSQRGTAYQFSVQALEEFLERNSLTHVIRAHEVQEAGFQVQQNGKLLTVFSSSHYCGGANEAACIMAHQNKLRTIRLDTS